MGISSFTFFILSVFIIGLLLLVAYSSISEANKNARIGSNLSRAILGLYTLGIIFLVFGVCFAVAKNQCTCEDSNVTTGLMYMSFGLVLGVTMAALGGIVVSEGNKEDSTANSLAYTIMIIGIVFSVAMIAIFILMYRDKMSTWFKGKKSSEDKKPEIKEVPDLRKQYNIPKDEKEANELLKKDLLDIAQLERLREDLKLRQDATMKSVNDAKSSTDLDVFENLGNKMKVLNEKIKGIDEQISLRTERDNVIKQHLYGTTNLLPAKQQQAVQPPQYERGERGRDERGRDEDRRRREHLAGLQPARNPGNPPAGNPGNPLAGLETFAIE
jgi:hypothetical protein